MYLSLRQRTSSTHLKLNIYPTNFQIRIGTHIAWRFRTPVASIEQARKIQFSSEQNQNLRKKKVIWNNRNMSHKMTVKISGANCPLLGHPSAVNVLGRELLKTCETEMYTISKTIRHFEVWTILFYFRVIFTTRQNKDEIKTPCMKLFYTF